MSINGDTQLSKMAKELRERCLERVKHLHDLKKGAVGTQNPDVLQSNTNASIGCGETIVFTLPDFKKRRLSPTIVNLPPIMSLKMRCAGCKSPMLPVQNIEKCYYCVFCDKRK